jgi:serine/threonine-protein kinase
LLLGGTNNDAVDFELGTGDVFAGHRIERVIGRGGMAVVYLAEHIKLGRKVALKVLHPHLAKDPVFSARFDSESQTAARLDHPNIVTIYHADEEDGRLYISMRYIDGSDLSKVLRDGPIEPSRTVAIITQIASALDTAHAEGLVHRDVKPANILLSKPGTPSERPFLTDFGIGKRLTTEEAFTRTGQFVGTVAYVAPEQIKGDPVDGRTDQYSLGCVLIECLSGRSPFQRETDIATMYAHLEVEPQTVDVEVPGMEEVTTRTLAKVKEDRYPTCAALADAVRSQLEPAEEPPKITAPYEIPPERQRRGRGSWLAAAVAAALVAIAVPVAILAAQDDRSPDPPGPSSTGTSSASPSEDQIQDAPMAINWNRNDWSALEQPARPEAGQVVITTATMTGDGGIVAAGHADDENGENAAVWIREGDARWVPREVNGGEDVTSDERIRAVAASGSRVVAVGYDGGQHAAWYSTDGGTTWEQAEVPPDDGSMFAVVARPSGPGFIAFGRDTTVGDEGAVWRSPDGSTWERVENPAFEAPSEWFVSSVVNTGETAIAVGRAQGPDGTTDAAVWEARDGAWVQVDPERFSADGEQYLLQVTESNGRAVAVGVDLVEVEDGIVSTAMIWTRRRDGTWFRPEVPMNDGAALWAVTGVDGRFFAAAGWAARSSSNFDAAVWLSKDGLTWRRQARNTTDALDLSGPLLEEIRALLADDENEEVIAFGGEAANAAREDSNAQVWIGSL